MRLTAAHGTGDIMEQRTLGSQGLRVGAVGLGCMGMTFAYAGANEDESRATLRRAVEAGVTLFDTADAYGPHTNEVLLGRALADVRGEIAIATKFGHVTLPDGTRGVDGTPEHVHRACDGSLRRLGVDVIDLYFQHRVDPAVPIEETVGAMSELVAAGKVRYIGLSEAAPATIRRAHAVHHLTAVQTEYSLWTRHVEAAVLPTVRELGVGFVAYSPLGRGFLTGAIRDRAALADTDARRHMPRFDSANLDRNVALLDALEGIAQRLGATPSQVSLAWVLSRGEDIVPIPGTTRVRHLDENLAGAAVELSPDDAAALDTLLSAYDVVGDRYPAPMMAHLDT